MSVINTAKIDAFKQTHQNIFNKNINVEQTGKNNPHHPLDELSKSVVQFLFSHPTNKEE